MLWEIYSSCYTEHNKTRFTIFGFLCDFIRFFKVAAKHTKGVRFISRTDPWKVLSVRSYVPGSQLHPWKEVRVSNVV
jgi:hypothetical protein